MAEPTRPVQDAIIDPIWGQWVHDHVVNSNTGALHMATVSNASAVPVHSGTAQNLGTIASLPCKAGDLFRVEVKAMTTLIAGNSSMFTRLGIEASGGGIVHSAQASPLPDQAILGGGSGQTQQVTLTISKNFVATADGTFAAGSRGWSTDTTSGAQASMSQNRCQITRLN